MHSAVHVLDGYVVEQDSVRARCSCGFLTMPRPERRAAWFALDQGHGLTPSVCSLCGDGDPRASGVGVPEGLTLGVHPRTGHDLLVCSIESGGCDPRSRVDDASAPTAQVSAAISRRGQREQMASDQVVILRAHGVLMERHGLTTDQARAALASRADHLGIGLVEAAHRVIDSVGRPRGLRLLTS